MRHLIDITELTINELEKLMETAIDIDEHGEKYAHAMEGKILATLFFEPRTRLSFEAAFIKMGGNVIGFDNTISSSTAKGESLIDTIKTVSIYADIIAMRHFLEGAAFAAALNSSCPIINAGDGGHCHPTQTLADILTIKRETGRLDNLTIGVCGDLKYGRAVHSLINALSRYKNNKFILISPPELTLTDNYVKQVFDDNGICYERCNSIEEKVNSFDILYMTRIQRERFDDAAMYERLKNSFELNVDMIKNAKPTMRILHPLPRVTEINTNVDNGPHAAYFKQVKNGMLMRMALILDLLKQKDNYYENFNILDTEKKCQNNKCVVNSERNVNNYQKKIEGQNVCAYCEKEF